MGTAIVVGISGVPANLCPQIRKAAEARLAIKGGAQYPGFRENRGRIQSTVRFRTRVSSPDITPWTKPASNGFGIGCAKFANSAHPPIARNAKPT